MFFFNYIWFSTSLFYVFLLPFSWLYGVISIIIRISYQYGLFKVHKFEVPVIVIGNVTIGGNGKTPMVLWLIEQLKYRGWKVGVVSRGYKGRSDRYPIVLNENSCVKECGDEPVLIWKRTGVLVAVAPKRSEAVSALLKIKPLDIIISDDGLQHYALHRDIEWVVVHAQRQFGNGCWLPAGPMRERVTRLNRVQAVIVHSTTSENIISGAILMKLYPSKVINLLTGECKSFGSLNNVIAIAGIGYPDQFFITLRKHGIFPVKTISFPDHHVYTEKMLITLVGEDGILLMTEKDAVKCVNFAHKNWWYVHIDVKINNIDTEYLLYAVENKIKSYKKSINFKVVL